MAKITEKIAALSKDTPFFSLEFFPPKTQMGLANLQVRLDRMARALRPLFVSVTWGAGGGTSEKSLELAEICQRQLGLTTVLHLTCTNSSRKLIDEALEQAKAFGIRNILALRGDAPRSDEYRDDARAEEDDSNKDFTWAVDLVRYVRHQYGDYFCIGVAAYPDGHAEDSHPEQQDPRLDLPYLIEKTRAGADFIMSQLFFDTNAWDDFIQLLRTHESGVFKDIPIIPGLLPIQSYQIMRRVTKLSHAKVPPDLMARLDAVKGDDEAVKQVGIDIISEIVEHLKALKGPSPKGFHFYALNLEKAVSQILGRCQLIPEAPEAIATLNAESVAVVDDDGSFVPPTDAIISDQCRRLSSRANSTPHNRVVVERRSSSVSRAYEAAEDEAGVPRAKVNSRAVALAISEGEGSLGREATWDDFPNGRWGDARSPAYGEIDGYGVSLHVSKAQALKYWGFPVSIEDISAIFRKYLFRELEALPWSEEALSPETNTIREHLVKLNDRNWWSVASQPGVNGVKSSDPVFGWGPRNGYVFQKPFVEIFLPSHDWQRLQTRLDASDDVVYFAGNRSGGWAATNSDAVNPVTWGTFAGKEIITPTIIEAVSFRAWLEEAFSIWTEWRNLYPPRSPSAKLLEEVRDDVWLVNIIHHSFVEREALWELMLA